MENDTAIITANRFNEITYAIADAGLKSGYAKGYQETVLTSLDPTERLAYDAQCKKMDDADAAGTDEGTF